MNLPQKLIRHRRHRAFAADQYATISHETQAPQSNLLQINMPQYLIRHRRHRAICCTSICHSNSLDTGATEQFAAHQSATATHQTQAPQSNLLHINLPQQLIRHRRHRAICCTSICHSNSSDTGATEQFAADQSATITHQTQAPQSN